MHIIERILRSTHAGLYEIESLRLESFAKCQSSKLQAQLVKLRDARLDVTTAAVCPDAASRSIVNINEQVIAPPLFSAL